MPKGNPAINAIAQGIRNRQLANTKKGLVASGKVLKDIRSETAKVNAKMEALIDECDSIMGASRDAPTTRVCTSCEDTFEVTDMLMDECSWCDAMIPVNEIIHSDGASYDVSSLYCEKLC